MVYIVVKILYPAKKGAKVGKKYLDVLQKYPEDDKMLKRLLNMVRATHEGTEGIIIYEPVKGRYEDALIWIGTMMQEYMDIENLSYNTNTYLNVSEALPIVGLSNSS